jgi:hypothetical protein
MLRKTIVAEDGSEVVLLWEMYRQNFGPMVEITTGQVPFMPSIYFPKRGPTCGL